MREYDVAVIGGGPAGVGAAISAASGGGLRVVVIERERALGGVLLQCLHRGFGLTYFGEELDGPGFAARLIGGLGAADIEILTGAAVMRITADRRLMLSGEECGFVEIRARAVVLATGCREKTIGSLPVAGARPSGIFTAGAAQRLINLKGYDIGGDVVILGSGDVGMIVARQLALGGKKVIAVLEKGVRCGGLERNRILCLERFHIPLELQATVSRIHGAGRIEGVTVRDLNSGEERLVACDTLITSIGLTPERELMDELLNDTGAVPDFLFVCGNACYVHDTVDDAVTEAARAGRLAAGFARGNCTAGGDAAREISEKSAVTGGRICIACPKGCVIFETPEGFMGALCGRSDPVLA